jgi:tripeptidyl-peptidase-1
MENGAHTAEHSDAWVKVARSVADAPVKALFMLKHQPAKMAELEETFWAVSDPRHARYGQHLSRDEVSELLMPAEGNAETVTAWLKENGVKDITFPNADMIEANMGVALAETLFSTKFFDFQSLKKESIVLRRIADPYSLPSGVAKVVELVGGIARLPAIRGAKIVDASNEKAPAAWPAGCTGCGATFVTPAVLAQRYGTSDALATLKPAAGNRMGTAEFQGQYWNQDDLTKFGAACKITANLTVANSIGGNQPGNGVEALLDVEYIQGIAPGIPLTNVYNAQYNLEDWAKQLAALSDTEIPWIMSVSYGNDEKQQKSTAYMQACNTQFMGFGARGVSILFASGDQGVYGRSGAGILGKEPFHPDFPAASPYITAVGGTNFAAKGVIGEETTWVDGGGGFSNTFGIPSYQTDAVAGYKTTAGSQLPPANLWNNTGRGYPDISALGGQTDPYGVFVGGRCEGVAGTSASCPVASGVFALLNNVRLAKGGKPLGFLNPFIYQNAAAFQDVTSGDNRGKGKHGFAAVKGWDPATGVGTPNYDNLVKVI